MYCPSCRGEFREGFTFCKDCEVDLVEVLPVEEESPDAAEESPEAPEERAAEAPAEKMLRARELLLVLFVGYGVHVLSSLRHVLTGHPGGELDLSLYGSLRHIVESVACLALLAYVLSRQGRGLRWLGLTAERSDLLHTLLLTVATCLPNIAFHALRGVPLDHEFIFHPATALLGSFKLGALVWIGLLLSAAAEELLVRAYMITEVVDLTGQAALAVFASTCFQGLYHLYQGGPSALVASAGFLISSVYYVIYRRATPLVLAHFLYNLMLIGYWRLQGG